MNSPRIPSTVLNLAFSLLLGVMFSSRVCAAEVTVDTARLFQTIEGFGTCLISWEPDMGEYYKKPEAIRNYADDLRFNILRCSIWGEGTIPLTEDASKISYRDPEFAKTDPRTPVFLQFGKALLKANPKAKIIGTVWSPPAWMKENNSIKDQAAGGIDGNSYDSDKGEIFNRVKKEFYPHFVQWMVEMARYYQSNGVPLYALSVANEPQFTQGFESCVWTAEDLAKVTGLLADALAKAHLDVKTFGPETMTGFNWPSGPNFAYTKTLRENTSAFKSLAFFATHGYSDGLNADMSQNSSAQFWQIIKDDHRPYWVTEGGTGDHQLPGAISEKGVGAAIHNAFVAGNASAFVPWQFAEGSESEHALMLTSGMTKKTQVVRHYSRYIAAGSVRVGATPEYGDVKTSAYVNEAAKTVTVVLLNPTEEEQKITLTLKGSLAPRSLQVVRTTAEEDFKTLPPVAMTGGKASFTMPKQSIVTLTNAK